MIDLTDTDIKNLDNDTLIDTLDQLSFVFVKTMIEVTQRSNNMRFTDEQLKRTTNIILNQTCNAYDTLNITEDQMDIGTKSIKNIIYDIGR